MHKTTALSTVNHQKFLEKTYNYGDSTVMHCSYIHVSLQLGEVNIHWPDSLEPITRFEYPRKSFCALLALGYALP